MGLDESRVRLGSAGHVDESGAIVRTGRRPDLVAHDRVVALKGRPDDVADGRAQAAVEGRAVGRRPVGLVDPERREERQLAIGLRERVGELVQDAIDRCLHRDPAGRQFMSQVLTVGIEPRTERLPPGDHGAGLVGRRDGLERLEGEGDDLRPLERVHGPRGQT